MVKKERLTIKEANRRVGIMFVLICVLCVITLLSHEFYGAILLFGGYVLGSVNGVYIQMANELKERGE